MRLVREIVYEYFKSDKLNRIIVCFSCMLFLLTQTVTSDLSNLQKWHHLADLMIIAGCEATKNCFEYNVNSVDQCTCQSNW